MNDRPAAGVRVDEARLTSLVEQLGRVGAQSSGGIIRPLYSPPWREAQDMVATMMSDAGLSVREDAVGNVFGRLAGDTAGPVLLTGSHIDTVVHGGAYDGALGVLSAIVALEACAAAGGTPRRTVEVVSLCEEESSRFHANYFGTRSILGLVAENEPELLVDPDGVTLAEAARSVGLDPARFSDARRDDIDTFLELHIEQGRTLVDAAIDVGVVDVITGFMWLEVVVDGRTDHAGATAMTNRQDALQAAARMITAVEGVALAEGHPAVATTGVVRVHPGGANIVPGRVEFTIDVRHPELDVLDQMVAAMREQCAAVATDRGVQVDLQVVKKTPPHTLDAGLRAVLQQAADTCGLTWRELPSGAGHDSQTMGTHVKAAMLFVPSVDGRSHSPAEYSTPHDCAQGASVLATAVRLLAWAPPQSDQQ
ncbi:Zn-dependent hydrolase [Rhodococcus antarcticus]|uniref:Zn-dependent hydrolase n=1 Tax=Rhodococcus antarcticus TaxID=2987751 RepID=A0ABY6P2A9_9NOCA|nr:Zn-dependent hydrolase [Rhodococcus antarcticus]UZJ25784.1 Zn-dependent hydrolase [Rhodococcus antarcticus]